MADANRGGFLAVADRLCGLIPVLGGIDLIIAWIAYSIGMGDNPIFVLLAGINALLGIPLLFRFVVGAFGGRSIKELGFSNIISAWWYAVWFRGYRAAPLAVALAAFASAVFIGRAEVGHTVPLVLLGSVFWSSLMVCHVTRRWPADVS
jgi:hypothetical protein